MGQAGNSSTLVYDAAAVAAAIQPGLEMLKTMVNAGAIATEVMAQREVDPRMAEIKKRGGFVLSQAAPGTNIQHGGRGRGSLCPRVLSARGSTMAGTESQNPWGCDGGTLRFEQGHVSAKDPPKTRIGAAVKMLIHKMKCGGMGGRETNIKMKRNSAGAPKIKTQAFSKPFGDANCVPFLVRRQGGLPQARWGNSVSGYSHENRPIQKKMDWRPSGVSKTPPKTGGSLFSGFYTSALDCGRPAVL